MLERRLRQALQRLNPQVPADALEEAFRKLTRPDSPSLVANNHVVHKYLVEGVPVEYQRPDGSIGGDLVRVLDYDEPENNEFLAVNQFTVVEEPARTAAGRRAVRQRTAAGGDRAEERRRRERHDLVGLQPASNLQAADSVAVRLQRGAGDLRRRAGAHRHADGQPRVVHALADHRGGGTGRHAAAAAAGGAGGRVRQAAVPGPDPAFHRVRGRRRRRARQEDGRVSPVPRGESGAGETLRACILPAG